MQIFIQILKCSKSFNNHVHKKRMLFYMYLIYWLENKFTTELVMAYSKITAGPGSTNNALD